LVEIEVAIKQMSRKRDDYKTKLYKDQSTSMREVNKVKLAIRRSSVLKVEYVLNEK